MDVVFKQMVDNVVESVNKVYEYVEMKYPLGTSVRVLGQCWLGSNITGTVSDYDFHRVEFIRLGIRDDVTNHVIFLKIDEVEIVEG